MGKATRRQLKYLRYLERACNAEPTLHPTPERASYMISNLEHAYKIVYNKQPMMRGS